jgi:dolichol-phosphate mannosyltransferase
MTDDVALARAVAHAGGRVAFRQGGGLVEVRMHESAREVWREWGRSIALADVTPAAWRAADAAVVWLTMALPVLRAASGRASRLDRALLLVRGLATGALAPAYSRRGAAFWLSALADPVMAARLTLSSLRPPRTWRGRTYGAGGRARR